MGLFDSFKKKPPTHEEKVALAYRCYKPDKVEMIFPGKKEQADKIIISLAKICNISLNACDAQRYYRILTIYSDVLIRKVLTHSSDEHIVTSLLMKHSEEIKDRTIALQAVAFVTLNMANNSFAIYSEDDKDFLLAETESVEYFMDARQQNKTAEQENLNDANYGLTGSKPIYTNGVEGSRDYLSKLRTSLGESVTWERTASYDIEGVNGIVDVYDIFLPTGKRYETIFINMYGTTNSTKAPKGFVLVGAQDINKPKLLSELQKISREKVISQIPLNVITLLKFNFVSYLNDGAMTTATPTDVFDYANMKRFEDLLYALATQKTIDGDSNYLDLVSKLVCPPSQISYGVKIFTFATLLANGEYTQNTAKEFEGYCHSELGKSGSKDYSCLSATINVKPLSFSKQGVSPKDLKAYSDSLELAIIAASNKAGISNWFRKYKDLSMPGFAYAQKIFNNGNGIIEWAKNHGLANNINQAVAVLCNQFMCAGVLSAEHYCQNAGKTANIDALLGRMDFNQITTKAANILGYNAGNDPLFIQKYREVCIAAANFPGQLTENPEFFMKAILLTLKVMYEYGTGLYFE